MLILELSGRSYPCDWQRSRIQQPKLNEDRSRIPIKRVPLRLFYLTQLSCNY